MTTSCWVSSGQCGWGKLLEYSIEGAGIANTPIICISERTGADWFEVESVPVGCYARESEERRKHRLSDICVRPKYVMDFEIPV